MEFCLPEAITAALISKGGQAIEKLRGLSLASITIQYSEGEGDGNSNIILRGERQSISETFSLILMRLLCLRPSLLLPVDSDARIAVSSRLDRTVLSRSESFSEFLFSALNPNIILGEVRRESANGNSEELMRDCSLSFTVSNKQAGSIIGSGGSVINDIRLSSNTSIVISKAAKGIIDRRVTVSGHLDNITQAGKLLLEHLKQYSNSA